MLSVISKENTSLSLSILPSGHLYLYNDPKNQEIFPFSLAEKLKEIFSKNASIGLLRLGVTHFEAPLPPTFSFWQSFSKLFVTEVCKLSGLDHVSSQDLAKLSPVISDVDELLIQAPFMRGGEYLNRDMMLELWQELRHTLTNELKPFQGNLQNYLKAHHAAWNKVGRVCFHLAENKADPQKPFAFLATYTTRLSGASDAKHLPLGSALKEYAGDDKRAQLLSLLLPVQKASEGSLFIKSLVETGSLFHPQAWGSHEAHQFLKDIPLMEEAGVIVRVPNWWNPKRPPRPQITVAVGNASTSGVGLTALLDFNMSYTLPDGTTLTQEELQDLLESQEQFVQIKGQWVQVNHDKLQQVLSHWTGIERQVKKEGLSFSEGLRLLAGASGTQTEDETSESVVEWSKVVEGSWLNEMLTHLRHPEKIGNPTLEKILHAHLHATLRPYQLSGVQWLWWLYTLRLGGCLADDMGLGKTIQVLSLLMLAKYHPSSEKVQPNLLIVPASLIGNWQAEILKFVPDLKVWIAHHSGTGIKTAKDVPDLSQIDLVITTYSYVTRLPWLSQFSWNTIVLDEAQNIKNPMARQTQVIKKLSGCVRFALTGTPVENRLLDLWSLFDFVAPGLLGSSRVFSNYGKKITAQENERSGEGKFYAAIRQLVSPYILRRLKSDKSIIADLPDKTEVNAYCSLSKQQIALYQHAIQELQKSLNQNMEGIQRRGVVLSFITRFKQICNHPSQWLGHGDYKAAESGKFLRLREICEEITAKQEKVLIFTQFREIIPVLKNFLEGIFGQEGLSLHGQTAVRDRMKLVEAFQSEERFPFFILSLKAGGTGLNLTNASQVIHFDRWWNPAVENQATDRAYRIGQKKNVLVHKFICQGTIEDKIDALIGSKKDLSNEVLAKGEESSLTELTNSELLSMMSLDIHRVLGETAA
ncbi:DEAD/DEAH box helicase [Candidatus Bealeia paramacronuclearis]|nr:DEAD/DEAH box helicase [Candidatus Bealeia paramacronuclearis]